jgi:L-ascorbate metabolism protein UlaG (beta-lactamase superfamily)
VALLPIAPIEPREFMQRVHTDPKEALQIFEDLGARFMIPIHHRTFYQGLEPRITYAQELLEQLVAERGLQQKVYIVKIGEQRIFE